MRNRLGLLYGILVTLLLAIGVWWVYFLTDQGRVNTEYRLQKLNTDRLHASFLIQADPRIAADPAHWLGQSFPHVEFRRGADGWEAHVNPQAASIIRAEAQRTSNMFLGEGLVFLVLLAAGSTILVLSVRSEQRFKQARELFLAGATHELKMPLASLRLYAETLARPGLKADDRERIQGRMVEDVTRLEGLVDEVLAMSAEDTFDPGGAEDLDLLETARTVVADLRRYTPEQAVTIDIRGDTGATVWGNRTTFTLALRNLLVNAIRHCPAPVTVAVTVTADPAWHRVAVRDNGPGIPRRLHERIFDCFFSGCRERSDAPGAGLGLYLVQRNVAGLGGRVELQSDEGQGSTFTMVLPARKRG
jgi:signal transduction histidine kinase